SRAAGREQAFIDVRLLDDERLTRRYRLAQRGQEPHGCPHLSNVLVLEPVRDALDVPEHHAPPPYQQLTVLFERVQGSDIRAQYLRNTAQELLNHVVRIQRRGQ